MQFFSPAQILGYAAFVLGVTAFLQKDDRRLKILIAAESLTYTAHFWLLENIPASVSAFITSGRTLLSLKTRSRLVMVLIICINISFGLAVARTGAGWLPIMASSLGTLAVFMLQGIPMRLVLLCCTLLWLANNIISRSIGGTLLEATIAVANTSTLVRIALNRPPTSPSGPS